MELFMRILSEPVMVCFFILARVLKAFSLVENGFVTRRAINMAQIGELLSWLVLAILVLGFIFLVLKFILENSLPEVSGVKDYSAMLTGILWRLSVVAVLYLILAALLHLFFGVGAFVLRGMEYAP